MYFFMNSRIQLILLVRSTDHFFFFIIGASPAGFRRTSTETVYGTINILYIRTDRSEQTVQTQAF